MEDRLPARWIALLGVAFTVVLAIRIFVLSGDSPDVDEGGAEVIAYYLDNEGREIAGAVVGVVAALLVVLFAAYLRQVIRGAGAGSGYLASLLFGGAIILAGGAAAGESIHFALVEGADDMGEDAAEALNALDRNFFFPIVLGFGLFNLALGLSIVRLRYLPVWLGWVAILLFVVAFTPVGFFSFIISLVLIAAVSVLLYLRAPGQVAPGEAAGS